MTEPVQWLPDGTPRSPRFDDIYRSATSGLLQARHVFLAGCGLPQAWAGTRQWCILETGFGLGLNFLAAWQAWRDDPERPQMLHFVSVEAWPVAAADLLRSAASHPEIEPLAQALAAQWTEHGTQGAPEAGTHRMSFEQGRVLLTLHVRDVQQAFRREPFTADSVFLDGFDPERNPVMWDLQTLKSVARHCRRGSRVATWTAAGHVRRDLIACGFAIDKAEGLPPKRHRVEGVFAPSWEPKTRKPFTPVSPAHCVVIGAGLAGSAVAASLARRGWRVTVVDAATVPAAAASGLPVGMIAPHHTLDDSLLSRLCRAGVRASLQQARELLHEGQDWAATGVIERRVAIGQADAAWHLHAQAGWIKPAKLVQAWLKQAQAQWLGGVFVSGLVREAGQWVLLDSTGQELMRADLVVVAAACGSGLLMPPNSMQLPLQPIRGQVSWGLVHADDASMPSYALKGNGHFIGNVPHEDGQAWYCGASFGRGETDLEPRAADHQANLERLQVLQPELAQQLAPRFAAGQVQAWTGVRCASRNRRPIVGEMHAGLWLSTAMGSRGLSFAFLCAELIAARLHGEPLPLALKLADALDLASEQRLP